MCNGKKLYFCMRVCLLIYIYIYIYIYRHAQKHAYKNIRKIIVIYRCLSQLSFIIEHCVVISNTE